MIKATLIGLSCFVLFLALHVVIFRAFVPKERFCAIKNIFFAVTPVYLFVYLYMPSSYIVVDTLGHAAPGGLAMRVTGLLVFLSGLMLYVFLFLGYCQFYFIVDRSISVRIMIEMERAASRRLNYAGILSVYSFDAILMRRLEHMLEGGYITRDERGYYGNTPKGRKEAALFSFFKRLLKLGPGG